MNPIKEGTRTLTHLCYAAFLRQRWVAIGDKIVRRRPCTQCHASAYAELANQVLKQVQQDAEYPHNSSSS